MLNGDMGATSIGRNIRSAFFVGRVPSCLAGTCGVAPELELEAARGLVVETSIMAMWLLLPKSLTPISHLCLFSTWPAPGWG
jgi:hypothetical protein